jgi:hypothetical protein
MLCDASSRHRRHKFCIHDEDVDLDRTAATARILLECASSESAMDLEAAKKHARVCHARLAPTQSPTTMMLPDRVLRTSSQGLRIAPTQKEAHEAEAKNQSTIPPRVGEKPVCRHADRASHHNKTNHG